MGSCDLGDFVLYAIFNFQMILFFPSYAHNYSGKEVVTSSNIIVSDIIIVEKVSLLFTTYKYQL